MNGIEKITSQIIADAEKYAENVQTRCRENCEYLRQTEMSKAEMTCAEERKKCEIECAGVAERGISSARVIERNILLDTKNAKIDSVFKIAEKRLTELARTTYFEFLQKNLEKAIAFSETYSDGEDDIYMLVLNAEDKRDFGEKLCKNAEKLVSGRGFEIKTADEKKNFSGGFILSFGGREIDCTFETLLRGVSVNMRGEINTLLFG